MRLPDTLFHGRNGTFAYVAVQVVLRYALVLALAAFLGVALLSPMWTNLLLVFGAGHIALALVMSIAIGWVRRAQNAEKASRLVAINQTQEQIEELFAMTDTLQAADSNADAAQVLRATSRKLLPGCVIFSDELNHASMIITLRVSPVESERNPLSSRCSTLSAEASSS